VQNKLQDDDDDDDDDEQVTRWVN